MSYNMGMSLSCPCADAKRGSIVYVFETLYSTEAHVHTNVMGQLVHTNHKNIQMVQLVFVGPPIYPRIIPESRP